MFSSKDEYTPAPKAPPMPPPLPPPEPPAEPKSAPTSKYNTLSNKSVKSMGLGSEEMQDELKLLLAMRENRRTLDILKTPDLFINQSSSASEVQSWLEAKGFQEDVRKKLRGTSGAELFKLEKAEFQAYAGEHEGWRLYSQLTVQRNVSGYKTTTSKELTAILQKFKERAGN